MLKRLVKSTDFKSVNPFRTSNCEKRAYNNISTGNDKDEERFTYHI